MTLEQWLEKQGEGAKNRLHLAAQVSPRVITRALERRATLASATKIHEATGRQVPVNTMTSELDGKIVPLLKPLQKKRRAAAIEPRRKRAARA